MDTFHAVYLLLKYGKIVTVEAVIRRCFVKKVFLEKVLLRNSEESTCFRVSFSIKLINKATLHRSFPVNFAKIFSTPFFQEHLWWLLL